MSKTTKTAFISHPDCIKHKMSSAHVESPQRLIAIHDRLEQTGLMATLDVVEAPIVQDESVILKAHTAELWDKILNASPIFNNVSISPEAIMSPGTLQAIRRGVGGTIEAVNRVCTGQNANAFVAIRPPGHHATREEAMGFCFVNNAAIGAYHALDHHQLSRVAIVDIDVHHGNGTEDVIANDPRLYMASTFAFGIYPGNGSDPMGSNMTNVGLKADQTGAWMRAKVLETVIPALKAFAPELIIVSAGYDAHKDDPLGNQCWNETDYFWWFEQLQEIANECAGGKLIAVLEGGYNVDALARSVEHSILAMQITAKTV